MQKKLTIVIVIIMKEAKNKINSALKIFSDLEFLNRIDDIMIFDILNRESIKKIVEIQIGQIIKRLAEKQIISLSTAVYDY